MSFLEWNDRLAAHFFRPEMAGRSVFLYVTQELLDELGAETGDTWRTFVETAKRGHPWRRPEIQNLCLGALDCLDGWRGRSLQYPPYLPYLGLFVLAAGKEGEFAPHAYYPRLRQVLDETGSGTYPRFEKMRPLWDDLERWANEDMEGSLGSFTVRVAGSCSHVGVPFAQTVLSEQERGALAQVFAAAHLDPNALPGDAELGRLLSTHGIHHLHRRTLKILRG